MRGIVPHEHDDAVKWKPVSLHEGECMLPCYTSHNNGPPELCKGEVQIVPPIPVFPEALFVDLSRKLVPNWLYKLPNSPKWNNISASFVFRHVSKVDDKPRRR